MDARAVGLGRGATPPLDFSGYFGSTALSDCTITIANIQGEDAAATPSAKRQKAAGGGSADVLPGHAIVLSTSSQWMRRQIESWAAGENAPPQDGAAAGARRGMPNITLHVRPGQEAAAQRLVRYIYEGPSSLPTAAAAASGGAGGRETQALLVDMLALSHTYRVPTCGSACLSRLLSVPLPQLAWATVSQVLRLPAAQLGAAELRPLIEACLNRLQGDYGDLERVASDAALLQRFCGLPFQAVLQLLLDERTAAASENTALALVHAWLAQQQPGAAGADERRALAGAVRLPQLEPLMLATVVPRMGWLAEVLGVEGLALAAGAARGQFDVAAEPVLSSQVPCMPPAWLRGPRPVPPPVEGPDGPQLTFDWSIPVHQLRQLFEDTSASAAARAASAVAAAAAEDLPAEDGALRTPTAGGARTAPPGDETDGGSTATGGALSLLGAGLFGWRRGGAPTAAAATAGGGGGGSVTSTPTKRPLQETAVAPAAQPAVPAAAPVQRQLALKLRSHAAVFAGHRFNMVLYFQEAPVGEDDGEAGQGEEEEVTGNATATRGRGGTRGGARRGRARAGGDDAAAAARAAAAAAAATASNQQEQGPQKQKAGGGGGGDGSSRWTVRLAVEAAPCVPLRGPSSVVAFSGRLSAVRGDASPSRSVTGEVDGTTTGGGGGAGRGTRSTGAGRSAGSSLARSGSDAFEDGLEGDEDGAVPAGPWEARELPQGSWVRSRACDTGFRDFFGVRLAQGKWDARAFRPFLIGPEGGALRLRCEVHNIR